MLKFICIFLIFLTTSSLSAQKNIRQLEKEIIHQFKELEGDFALAFTDLNKPEQMLLINADENFHAASTMKTPVMTELFKQAGENKFHLNDSILVKNEFKSIVDGSVYKMDIGEDSGEALYHMIGKKVTISDLMTEMITVSSNLATNILIGLVGADNVTKTMRALGAKDIKVLRGVEDLKAYRQGLSNTTTARDLMIIMKAIANGTAGSRQDCNEMIRILKDQKFNTMIPKYLPKSVVVAHKTGSITGVHHDSGIVFLPDRRSYVLVILSKNLKNFDKETDALAKISRQVFDFMTQKN